MNSPSCGRQQSPKLTVDCFSSDSDKSEVNQLALRKTKTKKKVKRSRVKAIASSSSSSGSSSGSSSSSSSGSSGSSGSSVSRKLCSFEGCSPNALTRVNLLWNCLFVILEYRTTRNCYQILISNPSLSPTRHLGAAIWAGSQSQSIYFLRK